MFSASFLATLCLAIQVSATPVTESKQKLPSLPFTKRFNLTSISHGGLLHHGQARAKTFKLGKAARHGAAQRRDAISVPVDNQVVAYIATVGVGSGENEYQLIIDTGSSNTWVGAGTPYVQTSTSKQTADKVSVTYGSGSFSGVEFTDQVVIGGGLVIAQQSIGVATTSEGFVGVDGILGIGPADLTIGTLSPDVDTEIPTVTDGLFANKAIPANVVGVSFEPTDGPEALNGELTWGGTDSSKFTGSITFLPLTQTSPANEFWGINGAIRFGSSNTILSSTAGIFDTGTSMVLLATDAFNKYKAASGAVLDSTTGLLSLSSVQFSKMQSLFLIASGTTFELTANGQLFPRNLNVEIGGTVSQFLLIVGDLGSSSGQGLDFILGMGFLERFYSVFDTQNERVGLAKTPFTFATTN